MNILVHTQRVFYFPLKTKLRALLTTKRYHDMCQHEYLRPANRYLMTDIYDAPIWRKFMGAATYPIKRIGLQFCVDGVPAFAAGTLSLKPAVFMNLSLPPAVRSKAKYMILFMLLPDSLKGESQKKYYDFAAEFELNQLFHTGIDVGLPPLIKVKVFSTSLDTRGKEEINAMQSCMGYQTCPLCTHCWSKPIGRNRLVYDGYRCFLPVDDPGRDKVVTYNDNVYEYR